MPSQQPEAARSGRVALVAAGPQRDKPAETLMVAGYDVYGFDDPYTAMLALCRKPLVFRAFAVSLQSIFPQELTVFDAICRRYPHVKMLICDTHGRRSATDRAISFGVGEIIEDDEIRAVGKSAKLVRTADRPSEEKSEADLGPPPSLSDEEAAALTQPIQDGPVLTPEELRALLSDAD